MPLKCFDTIANSNVHAFDQATDAWRALEIKNRKVRHLKMPCCSSQVVLKKSRLGTQFFAHKAVGGCTTAPETEAHFRLKRMAVEAARANGWEAETEVTGTTPSGEQWKADVLASKGKCRVAIEVQWSAQTLDETRMRQTRFKQSGVRCLWLMRQRAIPVDKAVPAASVSGTPDEGYSAAVSTGSEEQRLPLHHFLDAVFSKRLQFGVPVGFAANVAVRAGPMFCRSCGAETQIITGVDINFGPHCAELSLPQLGHHPMLLGIVLRHLPTNLKLGTIKQRFSKTQQRAYVSSGCAHCDSFVGEFYEHYAWESQRTVSTFPIRLDDRWREAIQDRNGFNVAWGVYPPE